MLYKESFKRAQSGLPENVSIVVYSGYRSRHPWDERCLFQQPCVTDQVREKTWTSEESVTTKPLPRSARSAVQCSYVVQVKTENSYNEISWLALHHRTCMDQTPLGWSNTRESGWTHRCLSKWRRQRVFCILQSLDPLWLFVRSGSLEDDDVRSPLSPVLAGAV